MKIMTGSPQPTVAEQPVDNKSAEIETGAARQKKAAKPIHVKDTVDLSPSLDAELKNRQAEQAERVESIKALVNAGEYHVGSRDVAKKMLGAASET